MRFPQDTTPASDWVHDAIVPSGDVDEDTTDSELEELADLWLEQAESEGVFLEYEDLLFWLRDARDWMRSREAK
jgi:hypothetical protein